MLLGFVVQLVWFLAPNVALAEQQHDVLSKYLPSSPSRLLIGADGVERWSDQNIWDEVLHNIRIVVSTHQVVFRAHALSLYDSRGRCCWTLLRMDSSK